MDSNQYQELAARTLIDKLKKRFSEGFTTEDSKARVDVGGLR